MPNTTNTLESTRVIWSTTDELFFRMTADLFPASLLAGATVLLASNDPDEG